MYDIDMITDAGEGEITVVTSESQGLLICCGQWFQLVKSRAGTLILFSFLPPFLYFLSIQFPTSRCPNHSLVLSGSWKDSEDTEKENQQTINASYRSVTLKQPLKRRNKRTTIKLTR